MKPFFNELMETTPRFDDFFPTIPYGISGFSSKYLDFSDFSTEFQGFINSTMEDNKIAVPTGVRISDFFPQKKKNLQKMTINELLGHVITFQTFLLFVLSIFCF